MAGETEKVQGGAGISPGIVREGMAKARISKESFFNPHMRFNRDVSSLAFGLAAKETMAREKGRMSVLDAFCSSGVRGMRYWVENGCRGSITFLDANKRLAKLIESNALANKLKKSEFKVAIEDFNVHYSKPGYDFVEIDPFGTPAPFIYNAMNQFRYKKAAYLSLTATDTAVLCGARHDACIKNYNSVPLNNDCCHENAIRILIGFAARIACQHNFGVMPLFSFSKRHYVKTIMRLDFGAEKAVEAAKTASMLAIYDPASLQTGLAMPFSKAFRERGEKAIVSGPLWGGKIWDKGFVEQMSKLNNERKLEGLEEVAAFLETIIGEADLPAYYFDTHSIFHKEKIQSVPLGGVIENLHKAGFAASRTHFSPTAIRTGAGYSDMLAAIEKSR
ncbi:MAG: hypothetical protein WC506_01300 [Candidatus Micrarchaeia archaeon]